MIITGRLVVCFRRTPFRLWVLLESWCLLSVSPGYAGGEVQVLQAAWLCFRLTDSCHFPAAGLGCKWLHCPDVPGSAGDNLFRLSLRKLEVVFPTVMLYHFLSGDMWYPVYTPSVGMHFAILWGCPSLLLEVRHWGAPQEKFLLLLAAVLQPLYGRVWVYLISAIFTWVPRPEEGKSSLDRDCSLNISGFFLALSESGWV